MSPSFTPNWLSGAPAFVLWARRASSPRDLSRARISLTVMPRIIRATLSKPTMRELKWLESLAPKPPPVDADQRGNLQLLEIIQENTEYPFWSAAKESAGSGTLWLPPVSRECEPRTTSLAELRSGARPHPGAVRFNPRGAEA